MIRLARLIAAAMLYGVAGRLVRAAASSISRDKIMAHAFFKFYSNAIEKIGDVVSPLDPKQANIGQYPEPTMDERYMANATIQDTGKGWLVVVRSGSLTRQCFVDGDREAATERAKQLAAEVGEYAVQ